MNPFKLLPYPVRERLADSVAIVANIVNVPSFFANIINIAEAVPGIIYGPVESMRDPFDPAQSLLMRDSLDDEDPSCTKNLYDCCICLAIPVGLITAPITVPLAFLESIIRS